MVTINLENGFDVTVEIEDDKELDFALYGTGGGFQTMLTKKDAKEISRVLDRWISNLPLG